MPRAKRAPTRDQLQMEVDLIAPAATAQIEAATSPPEAVLPPPAPPPERAQLEREAFGAWLLKQAASARWYGQLAKVAKSDRRYPKHGDPEAVSKHMQAGGGDSEVVEMLEDAERDWLAL